MIYQRETKEFLPINVTRDGVPAVTGVEFAITLRGARPETWIAPVTSGDEIGVMLEGLDPGTYAIWARVTTSLEVPVILVDTLQVY